MADVNAHVHELAERLAAHSGDDELWAFRCECGSMGCEEKVPLTLARYEEIRRRHQPVLAPGHTAAPRGDV